MTMYAYLQDVAGDWDTYERVARILGDSPPDGLIIRVAGATTVGYRIIEVWESQGAWHDFRELQLRPALRAVSGEASPVPPTFCGLVVDHAILSPNVHPSSFRRCEPRR